MPRTKRMNITIPTEAYELLRQFADQFYEGNLSRMLTDAGLFYVGILHGSGGKPEWPAPTTPPK